MNASITSALLAAVLIGLLSQSDAMAQQQKIYKWVDEEGVVHYTARPPDNVEFEQLGVATRDPAESESEAGQAEGEDDEASNIPPEQPEMAATEPDPEVVAERCEQARRNIENLTQRANVLIRGDDGERRQITDAERQSMLAEAQQFIDEWC